MKENKRELIGNVLHKEAVDRVPIGFWWHYIFGKDLIFGYQNPETPKKVAEGHKRVFHELEPDIMKIMGDGFFAHPSLVEAGFRKIEDVANVKPLTKDHPWISRQVEMVKEISEYVHNDVMTFYNLFSPLQALRLNMKYLGVPAAEFQEMTMEYPDEIVKLCRLMKNDYILLVEELKKNTVIDGIYYSVQNIQDPRADEAFHRTYVFPTELELLDEINSRWDYTMLHMCGYDHFRNNLNYYKDYRVSVYNWAVNTDKVTLKEGKEIFHAPVLGGFDNNKGTLLDSGSYDDIEKFVRELIAETGSEGMMIGADCTIPSDIDLNRLKFVRECAKLK